MKGHRRSRPGGATVRNPIASSVLRISAKTVGVVYCMLGLVLVTILPTVGLIQLEGEWIDGTVALIIPILTLALLRGSRRHLAVTAWYGALLGLLLVGMGVGHLVGVTSVARSVASAYDSRHVFLITIGGILICTGLLDVAATRAIRQGARAAISLAAFRTVSLIAFLGLLLPLPDGGGNTSGFLVLNVGYLTLLTFDWLSQPQDPGGLASNLTAA
jgi:hypothetical protein